MSFSTTVDLLRREFGEHGKRKKFARTALRDREVALLVGEVL